MTKTLNPKAPAGIQQTLFLNAKEIPLNLFHKQTFPDLLKIPQLDLIEVDSGRI
jgi:hypothetical protein